MIANSWQAKPKKVSVKIKRKKKLFAGRGVRMEKNCALGLCTDFGIWPRSLRKTSGTVFLNTDLPAGKKHIYIVSWYFFYILLYISYISWHFIFIYLVSFPIYLDIWLFYILFFFLLYILVFISYISRYSISMYFGKYVSY